MLKELASVVLRIMLCFSIASLSKQFISNWLLLGLKCIKPDEGEGSTESTAEETGEKKYYLPNQSYANLHKN